MKNDLKFTSYLFVYFTNNENEKLYYGISDDGYNFKALNGGLPVFTSEIGTGGIRDPFVFRGEDGEFYIVATDMKAKNGWASQSTVAIFKTHDLIPKNGHFDSQILIDYKNFSGFEDCNRAWAPQMIWCPEKNAYMVYITLQCASSSDTLGTVMYRHYTTDIFDHSAYTTPEIMVSDPATIDGDIIYDPLNERFIMYCSGRRIFTSNSLTGDFVYEADVPFLTDSGEKMLVEGSNIYRITGENKWIICADGTPFNGKKYAVAETYDLKNYRQLDHNEYSFDFTPRHGYVIPITNEERSALLNAFPKSAK